MIIYQSPFVVLKKFAFPCLILLITLIPNSDVKRTVTFTKPFSISVRRSAKKIVTTRSTTSS